MENCLFCKLVTGEIPHHTVYEDKDFIAFLDIFPRTKGHTLVIPKRHYRWVYDVSNFEQYWGCVLKVTKMLQKSLKPYFITYVTHGLQVPHAHIHIMPRYEKGNEFVPDIQKTSQEELEKILKKITRTENL
jgi:histidine triad (HIT) family protein